MLWPIITISSFEKDSFIYFHNFLNLAADNSVLKLKCDQKTIRIYHEFVDRIDNSIPRVTAWHHEALPSDPKQ